MRTESFIESGAYPILEGATDASIRQLLLGLFAGEDRSCLRVVEDRTGQIVGGLAFVEDPQPMTGELYADDVCWGVLPGYRSTLAQTASLPASCCVVHLRQRET